MADYEYCKWCRQIVGGCTCDRDKLQIEVSSLRYLNARLRGALIKSGAWRTAPCCVCGYNGPGYFQPATHECARIASEMTEPQDENKRLRTLLRESIQDPERVEVNGVRQWELMVSDQWMQAARAAGGGDE